MLRYCKRYSAQTVYMRAEPYTHAHKSPKALYTFSTTTLSQTSYCPAGHVLNAGRGECEDINECESDEVTCDIDTQVCFNTAGSYKCLDIISYEKQSAAAAATEDAAPSLGIAHDCEPGLRYNTKTDECDGMRAIEIQRPSNSRTHAHVYLCSTVLRSLVHEINEQPFGMITRVSHPSTAYQFSTHLIASAVRRECNRLIVDLSQRKMLSTRSA